MHFLSRLTRSSPRLVIRGANRRPAFSSSAVISPLRLPLRLRLGALAALAAVPAGLASAAEPVDFSRDVLPVISAHCFPCHGRDAASREAKLRLDLRDDATTPRGDITPIAPGNPDASEVIARVLSPHDDERMPPPDKGRALNATEISALRAWIAQGADYREHWSFLPVTRPELPAQDRAGWARSPIDRFVAARHEQAGVKPSARASRTALIRRATLDLTGLPPTPAEIAAFLADPAGEAAAFATVVERLLASPHYGERWGRHWLDVARYADSGGFETDIFFGHAWRYRDYVIRSFNADKPFDRFIREQIAADELFPGDAEARLGTGLFTTGPVLQEAGMVSGKLEYDQNTDFVDTTGAGFLGLTLGCARCHDHKYDPVSQREYFSLQAIFAASDQFDFAADGTKLRDRAALKNTQKEFEAEQARTRAAREHDPARRAELLRRTGDAFIEANPALKGRIDATRRHNLIARAVERHHRIAAAADSGDPAETSALLDDEEGDDNTVIALKAALRGLLRLPSDDRLEPALLHVGVVALLNPAPRGSGGGNRSPSPRRAFAALTDDAAKRTFLLDLGRQQLELSKPTGYIDDIDALRLELGEKHLHDASPIPQRFLAHRETPLETRLLKRGELDQPGDAVEPGLPEKFAAGHSLAAVPPDRRRAALAEWIASDRNVLTARAIANRVWQWHFGAGLVRTPNDLGIRGDPPSHPQLLDWLAAELVAHGWSLKHLHRVILASSTYQQGNSADAATLQRDPDNVLLTRFQPYRLEAEVIWDTLRAVAGTLDLTLYGLPVAPPLDEQEQLGNYRKWPVSTPEEANRRAIYLLVKRSFRFPMLSAFDLPDNVTSCGRRDITTVPNQALTLLNHSAMLHQSAAFAARLWRDTGGQIEATPERAWQLAYGRPVSEDERRQALAFLEANGSDQAALARLCLAIFNTNEFIYQQ